MKLFFKSGLFAAFLVLSLNSGNAVALDLEIEVNPNPVRPGNLLHTQMVVTNTTSGTLTNVTVQATMPAGVNRYDSTQSTGGGTCAGILCDPGDLITWNIGSLAPGAGRVVTMAPSVVTNLTNGTIIQIDAVATADGESPSELSRTTTVDSDGALALAVDADQGVTIAGQQFVYTVHYGNRSTASVTGTSVSVPLPAGATFVSASNGGNLVGGTEVQWNIGRLNTGESGYQQLTVNVDEALIPGSLMTVDSARISGTNATTVQLESAASMSVVRVVDSIPFPIRIEMNPDPIIAFAGSTDEELRVQFTVTNTGVSALTNAIIEVRMPDQFGNPSPVTGTATCNNCQRGRVVTWTIGQLSPGEARTVSMKPRPIGVDGELVTVEAIGSADAGFQSHTRRTAAIDGDRPLMLELNEGANPKKINESLTYTLNFANQGGRLTDSILSLPVPSGAQFVSASDGGVLAGNAITWDLGTIFAQETGARSATFSIDGGLPSGSLLQVNAAEISGLDPITFRNEATRAAAVTRVEATRPITVAQELSPDPFRPFGEFAGFIPYADVHLSRIIVTNTSGSLLTNVLVQATVPEDIVEIEFGQMLGDAPEPAGIDPVDNFGRIRWTIPALAPGEGKVVGFPTLSSPLTQGSRVIPHEVIVSADGVADALVSSAALLDADDPFMLEVNAGANPVVAGEQLVYTITYGNRSATSIANTLLSLPLPPGTSFVSANFGGILVGNTVEWDLGTVVAGGGGHRRLVVETDPTIESGTVLQVEQALISGINVVSGNPETARANAAARVVTDNPLKLDMQVLGPTYTAAGEPFNVVLAVSNTGVSPLFGVRLQVRLPPGLVRWLGVAYTTGNGTCDSVCGENAMLTWDIGSLAPESAVQVTMFPPVDSVVDSFDYFLPGRLITLDASVVDDSRRQAVATATVIYGAFADADFDGIPDEYEIANGLNPNNPFDADEDNDSDGLTNLGEYLAGTDLANPDTDGDGVIDGEDAFPNDPSEQFDNDQDGIGDNADPDDDNDTVEDVRDNCQFVANSLQEDNEGDGIGDVCDDDDDNDTRLDVVDNCPLVSNFNQRDADFDGAGNACDPLVSVVALPDMNGNGSPDLGVTMPGGTVVHVRDGASDALINTIDFGTDAALQIAVVPDLNASGMPELAVLNDQPSGQVRVQVRDSATGALTGNFFYGQPYAPVAMRLVGDYNSNGFPEIAVMGSDSTDAIRVQVKDADTGTTLDNVFLGNQGIGRDFVAVADTSGNSVPELGILSVLKGNGQVRTQVWDAANATFQTNVWFGKVYQPYKLMTMPDINTNGSEEIVAIGVDPATQNIRVQVRDSASTITHYNIWLGNTNQAVDVALINDINGNGSPDLAILLKTPTGTGRVRVQDGLNGAFIRNLFYTVVTNPAGLAVMPDYSGNGFEELAVLGESAGVRHVQILDTVSGSQVNRIDYP